MVKEKGEPMAEYITKKQVIEWFSCYGHDDKQIRFEDLSFDVQNMNPEDVAPVVHGRWMDVREKRLFGDHYFLCSNCKSRNGLMISFNYCPNCGARMDLEWQNETKET